MSLSGVEILELLPRINCQKCGYPRCLSFAMKLAEDRDLLALCQRLSEDARRILSQGSPSPVETTDK